MPANRKFRFGVQLSTAAGREEWADKARRAEDLGYATLLVPDHFDDQFAPVPALMAAADATTSLRVGTLVFDNDYRHPLVLAKEVATLDVLSGGRLEVGLGAGWMRSDYEQSGIPYDPPAVRVDRFEEGLAVLAGLLAEGPFSFTGKHYSVDAHEGRPRPVQRPRPPILVGGGSRRVLTIAGRAADIVGITFDLRAGAISPDMGPDGTAERTEQKLAWVRAGAGARWDGLELSMMIVFAAVTDDRDSLFESVARGFRLTPEQAAAMPAALVGTVDQIVESLEARRDRFGFSYIVFQGDAAMETMAPVVARLAGT